MIRDSLLIFWHWNFAQILSKVTRKHRWRLKEYFEYFEFTDFLWLLMLKTCNFIEDALFKLQYDASHKLNIHFRSWFPTIRDGILSKNHFSLMANSTQSSWRMFTHYWFWFWKLDVNKTIFRFWLIVCKHRLSEKYYSSFWHVRRINCELFFGSVSEVFRIFATESCVKIIEEDFSYFANKFQ